MLTETTTTLDTPATIERLNRHLADALLLAAEAKAWHWSVYGPTFPELHALFEAQAESARRGADELAERVVQLGGVPAAFPQEWLARGALAVPEAGSVPAPREMLRHFAANLDRIIASVREDIPRVDPTTADILTDWLRETEKNRWMVTATARE